MAVNMWRMAVVRMLGEIDEACCPSPLSETLDAESAERLAGWLRVLADPARLRLLSLISACEAGEGCVCDLTGPVGLSQPTVSHHLKLMNEAGILDRERRGRWVYYRVRTGPLRALAGALTAPASAAVIAPAGS
jgi:ArsR family transcriptional regulator, arsenate/arsenite/antimonite-responsive transcriptional repressor